MIGRTLGHYEVVGKLGEGGMGAVFKAKDTHLDRFVALKVLPHEKMSDPERRRRFTQEAKAASALNHPNIITIYDISSTEGVDFIAMEYVEGRTLEAIITAGPLRVLDTLKYARQMADALAAAHAAGILHRDLKPANVMVKDSGLVKVLDFGLAKLTDESVDTSEPDSTRTMSSTRAGQILGTAAYMSPEQAEGKKLDFRSDIFSFGAVLYEMAAGRRAFPGDSHASVMAAILRDDPRPVTETRSDMPWELDQLISRCLRKESARRVQTMADLKTALEDLPDPVTKSSTTSSERFAVAVAPPPVPVATTISLPPPISFPPPVPTPPPVMYAAPAVPPPPVVQPPAMTLPPPPPPADVRKPKRARRSRWWIAIVAVFALSALFKQIRTEFTAPARPAPSTAVLLSPGIPLTANPGIERMPALSPDGNRVVYLWNGVKPDHFDIYIKPVGEGAPVRLTKDSEEDFAPAWSPDGNTIAFLQHKPAADDILLIPAPGGAAKKVGEVARSRSNLYGLAWKKDGQHLIVSDASSTGAEPSLFDLSISTGQKKLILTKPAGSGGDFFPSVSPSGKKVAFVRSPDAIEAQVLTFDLEDDDDDASVHHVAALAMKASRPVWTANGRQLIFALGEVGSSLLWRAQSTGQGKPVPLLGVASGTDPTVSGNRLIYSSNPKDGKSQPLLLVDGFR